MNLYENLKKSLNESYGDKENDLNHDAGYLFDAKNCRKYLNDLKKILVYNSDQYRANITNLDKGGECQITIDYYMLVALCKLYEERIKELESNGMNEAEEPEKNYEQMSLDFSEQIGFRYIYNFELEFEVNDFDAASGYLTEDDMREYIDDDLKDVVTRVEWILDDTYSGHVEVDTKRELTDDEEKRLVDWIQGQNSDGLGEGFEQQDFAESYFNPVTGDGPYTRYEAEQEVQRLFDEMDSSEYADYLDTDEAVERYIEENFSEEEAEEADRDEVLDTIMEYPEDYFTDEEIDEAKFKVSERDPEYNENEWYSMASIKWDDGKTKFDSVEELRTEGV